jgi:hypothetical protein
MKGFKIFPNIILLSLLVVFLAANSAWAQDDSAESTSVRPVRDAFKTNLIIDNQSALVPFKGTFEFDIQHRFGTVNNGYDDFFGLYAPSNIRLGFSYVPVEKLQVGFGFTKNNLLWDFNVKYNIFTQGREGGAPLFLTYYGNAAVDTREGDYFHNSTDRYSYFHQLIAARKMNDKFTVQAAASLSHFNAVPAFINSNKEIQGKMKNDHIAVALMGRYKLTEVMYFIVNYDQPITEHLTNNPHPNISFGLEMTSSSHSFQVFAGNYRSIVPQYNNVFNRLEYEEGEFLIGFNITRLWNW